MQRTVTAALDDWLRAPDRKPLVLRGARQVGKTWLVRDLAGRSGRHLAEINFERDPSFARYFRMNDPAAILGELSLALSRDISPERSLLFLDEIQAAPAVFAKLRWFYEEMPSLPVVAAGSLLELTIGDGDFSMPVGRVSFQHVEPMGFPEFLEAHGQQRLLRALREWRPQAAPLSEAAHEQAAEWFHRYSMVGGMPAVVTADAGGRDARACRELQRDLVAAFRGDFAKYSGRMHPSVLDATLRAVAGSLGRKLVYAHFGDGVKQHQARRALDLLAGARVCHLVRHSAANGLPLGAEVKDTFRKAILADVGLAHALLGTPAAAAFPAWTDLAPAVRGRGPHRPDRAEVGSRRLHEELAPVHVRQAPGPGGTVRREPARRHGCLRKDDARQPGVVSIAEPAAVPAVGAPRGGGGGHGVPPHSLSALPDGGPCN